MIAGLHRVGPIRRFTSRRSSGFTLAEMVIAIVITAIVAAAVAVFIRLPVRGYVDSVARADIADTGDAALRRIARDLRLALPNSVRLTTDGSGNQYLEFLLTRTGGRYLSADDFPSTGNILDFRPGGGSTFDVVGPMPSTVETIQAGDSVVVHNTGGAQAGFDAYYTTGSSNRALINSVAGNTITMASNPFASQTISNPSPNYRFQIVSGPVTYRCDLTAHTLTRYWNYTIAQTQPNSIATLSTGASKNALAAIGVTGCVFNYTPVANASAALAELNLVLSAPASDNGNGGSVSLFQQVHVDNTP
jgi:MSHA biogenesis protein MshO